MYKVLAGELFVKTTQLWLQDYSTFQLKNKDLIAVLLLTGMDNTLIYLLLQTVMKRTVDLFALVMKPHSKIVMSKIGSIMTVLTNKILVFLAIKNLQDSFLQADGHLTMTRLEFLLVVLLPGTVIHGVLSCFQLLVIKVLLRMQLLQNLVMKDVKLSKKMKVTETTDGNQMLTHKVLPSTLLVMVVKVTLDTAPELLMLNGVLNLITVMMSVSCVLLMLVDYLNSLQELFKNMM